MKTRLIATSAMLLTAMSALAQDGSATLNTSGNWSNALIWSPNSFAPINGQNGQNWNATVNASTVTVDMAVAIQNLLFGGGTINGAHTLTLHGIGSAWTGGTFSGTGITQIASGATLNISGTALKEIAGRALNIGGGTGTAITTWTGAGNINLADGTIRVQNGGLFDIQNDQQIGDNNANSANGALVVEGGGILRKSAGGATTTIGGTLGSGTNTVNTTVNAGGLVEVQSGTLRFLGTFSNHGTANANARTLLLNGGGTSSGTFHAGENGTIQFTGGTQTLTTVDMQTAAITGAGRTSVAGGRLDVAGMVTVDAENFGISSGTLGGAGTLNISGTFEFSGGAMDTAGGVTNLLEGATASISGSGDKVISGRFFNISGEGAVATWTGTGRINLEDGRITVSEGGLFDIQTDAQIGDNNANSINGAVVVIGGGILRKSVGTGTTQIGGSLGNGSNTVILTVQEDGTVQGRSGVLSLVGGGSVTGTGKLEVSSGARMDLNSAFTFNGGVINGGSDGSGTGAVRNNNTMTISGPTAVNGLLEMSATGSMLTGAGTLTVNSGGVLNWSGGTMSGAGTTQIDGGGALNISGTPVKEIAGRALHIGGGTGTAITTWTGAGNINLADGTIRVQNGGLFDIQNDQQIGDNNANSANGALVVEGGGILRKSAGGATTTIGGTLGSGTNTVNLTVQSGGTVQVRSGVLALASNTPSQSGTTLVSGNWEVSNGAALNFSSGSSSITTIGSNAGVILDGAGSSFAKINTLSSIQGSFILRNNRDFTTGGNLTNSGILRVEDSTTELRIGPAGVSSYSQSAGSTLLTNNAVLTAGNVNINGGTLAAHGTINAPLNITSGIVEAGGAGSAGVLNVVGDVAMAGGSLLRFNLGGTTGGTLYDQILANASVLLGGGIEFDFINGFESQLTGGEIFTVLTSTQLSGVFVNVANGGRLNNASGTAGLTIHYGEGSLYDPTSIVFTDLVVYAPVDAMDDTVEAAPAAAVISVMSNDTVQAPYTLISAVTQGTHGAVTITNNGTTVTYTPGPGFAGADSFTYTIVNGLYQDTATVTIQDTTPPVIAGSFSNLAELTGEPLPDFRSRATVSDNGLFAGSLVQTPAPGSIHPSGLLPVTLSALDAAGNEQTLPFTVAIALPGELIANFGQGGWAVTDIAPDYSGSQDLCFSIAEQADGKILMTGQASTSADAFHLCLIRHNPDGSLDTSFGNGGKVVTVIGDGSEGRSVVVQPDGKILVAGRTWTQFLGYSFLVTRYTETGALDGEFGTGGIALTDVGADAFLAAMTLQADGKIVVAGNGLNDIALVRLLPSGEMDSSFGNGGRVVTDLGGYYEGASAIAIQPDGKIVVAGNTDTNTERDLLLLRYLETGTLDPSFSDDGILLTDVRATHDFATGVALQSDGNIVVAGISFSGQGTDSDACLVRCLENGSLDMSFGNGGKVVVNLGPGENFCEGVQIEEGGKVLLAARTGDYRFALARLLPNGALDAGFGTGGKAFAQHGPDEGYNEPSSMLLQADGNILVGGHVYDPDSGTITNFALARFKGGSISNTPPELHLPDSPIIVEATSFSGAPATFTVTAEDAEDGALAPVLSKSSGSIFPLGSTTVSVSATDSHGFTTTGSFVVTVQDTTPPVSSTPNLIVNNNFDPRLPGTLVTVWLSGWSDGATPPGTPLTYTVLANDVPVGSGTTGSVTFTLDEGVYTLKGRVTDAAGNHAFTSPTLPIRVDGTGPTITTPPGPGFQPLVIGSGPTGMASVPNYKNQTVPADPIGVASFVQEPPAGTLVSVGVHPVTLTATDTLGNSTTLTLNLTVNDTTPPMISPPPGGFTPGGIRVGTNVPDFTPQVAVADNVEVTEVLQTPPAGTLIANPGILNVTLTAMDSAGNSSQLVHPLVIGEGGVSFGAPKYTVQQGADAVVLTLVRTDGSTPTTVTMQTDNGTAQVSNPPFSAAVAGTDYIDLTGAATLVAFADGETSKELVIILKPRTGTQTNKRFNATLTAATNGVLVEGQTSTTIEIMADDTTPPTLTVTSPRATTTSISAGWPYMIQGSAGDSRGLDRVEVVLNGAQPVVAMLGSTARATSIPWSLNIEPPNGPNTLAVTAYDNAGNTTTVSRSFVFTRRHLLTLSREVPAGFDADFIDTLSVKGTPGTGKTSLMKDAANPHVATTQVEPNTAITVTARPKPGFVFSHWSATPPGAVRSGSALQFQMPGHDAEVNAVFIESPFAGPPGSSDVFQGLIRPLPGTPVSNRTTGYIHIVLVPSTGAVSGNWYSDGIEQRFVGAFNGDGSSWFTTPLKGATLMHGTLFLTLTYNAGAIDISLVDGAHSSTGVARRGIYSAANPVPANLLNRSSVAGGAIDQGFYTFALPSKPQSPPKDASAYPQGDGFGTMTLKSNGTLTLSLNLADGTRVNSRPAVITQGHECILFAQLAVPGRSVGVRGGNLNGMLSFDTAHPDSDVTGGDLLWIRPPVPEQIGTTSLNKETQIYTDGWPEGITVDLVGALYDFMRDVQTTLGLPTVPSGSSNGLLSFTYGKLPDPGIDISSFRIVGNVIYENPVSSNYSISASQPSGTMSGSFRPTWAIPASALPTYKGILLRKGASRGGYGFFISNIPNDLNPESGRVILGEP